MPDVQMAALEEINRIRRTYDIGADQLLGHEEIRLLRESHGLVAAEGDDPGTRFANSASLEAWRQNMVGTAAVPVLEAHEIHQAATVVHPPGRTSSEVNALKELAAPSRLLSIADIVSSGGTTVGHDLGLNATELTTGSLGLTPQAPSREVTLTGRGTDHDLVRISLHAGVRMSTLDGPDDLVRRLVNDLVRRLLLRALVLELIEGDGSTVGDQQRLSGLAEATITSVDAATGDKVAKVAEAVAAVQAGWSERPVIVTAHPTSLQVLRDAATWRRDRLPDEVVLVPFGRLAAGTVWVAAEEAVTLFSSAVLVEMRTDHASDFLAGRAVVQPVMYGWAEVGHEDAAAKVVNF